MDGYQNILVAYDLKPDSMKLLQKAVALQQSSLTAADCKINVLHVVEHIAQAYGGEFSIPVDVQVEAKIDDVAKQKCIQNMSACGIPENLLIMGDGSVKKVVLDVAANNNIDLILVGAHNSTGLERLLGSRAQAILNTAACDVLSIRL